MFNHSFLKTLDILYIESDNSTRTHYTNILNKLFNSVIAVETAEEGINKFISNKNEDFDINIILCDLKLNQSSGLEVLEKIREIDEFIPFILTSNETNTESLINAVKFRATDFLLKPVNAKDLVYSVEKVCHVKYHDNLKKEVQQDLEDLREVINDVALVTKTDLEGTITFANQYFCDIAGFSQEEVIGKTHKVIEEPSMNQIINDELKEVTSKGEIWEGKIKYISKNNEEFYVYSTVVPLYCDIRNQICEYMRVMFLTTDEELEQKEFKKKVAKNIHENRRINTEARDKIDELTNKIYYYKGLDSAILDEQKRASKFSSQINHYKTEIETGEKKLKDVSEVAKVKIKKVVADEKITREKRDKTAEELNKLTAELNIKNKSIKELTAELENQTRLIDKLKREIQSKEDAIGI